MTTTEQPTTTGARTPGLHMAQGLSVIGYHMPSWLKFEINERTGFVTFDFDTLGAFGLWAAELGFHGDPIRYTYAAEGIVRYNARWTDPLSGWRFDLNFRLAFPEILPLNEDTLDAVEIVLEAGV